MSSKEEHADASKEESQKDAAGKIEYKFEQELELLIRKLEYGITLDGKCEICGGEFTEIERNEDVCLMRFFGFRKGITFSS